MKVLKSGTWNVPWVGEGSCPTCEALLEVAESDLRPTYSKTNGFECVCVECGHVIPIKAEKLPLRVREMLEKKRRYATHYSGRD